MAGTATMTYSKSPQSDACGLSDARVEVPLGGAIG